MHTKEESVTLNDAHDVAHIMGSEKKVVYNPFSKDFLANPYPFYDELRTQSAIFQIKSLKSNEWLVLSNKAMNEINRNSTVLTDNMPDLICNKIGYLPEGDDFYALIDCINYWLFFLNPPKHKDIRVLLNKWFSPKAINGFTPMIKRCVEKLFKPHLEIGKMDAVEDIALLLPAMVSCEILGVDEAYIKKISEWSIDIFHVLEPPLSLQQLRKLNDVAKEFYLFIEQYIESKRNNKSDDLISYLVDLIDENVLDTKQAVSICVMIFGVGQETTANLLTTSLVTLLKHPLQMKRLKADLSLMPKAIDEVLRYDPPVQLIVRTVAETFELNGSQIKKDDRLYFCIGAINRDPSVYQDPNVFDIDRKPSKNLSFGHGLHYCLGAALAKVQVEIALTTFLSFNALKIDTPDLEYRRAVLLRGVKTLPITFK